MKLKIELEIEVTGDCSFEEAQELPAWSLHRLYEMYLSFFSNASLIFRSNQNPYDVLISDIEQMIDDGFFNKEYLK